MDSRVCEFISKWPEYTLNDHYPATQSDKVFSIDLNLSRIYQEQTTLQFDQQRKFSDWTCEMLYSGSVNVYVFSLKM